MPDSDAVPVGDSRLRQAVHRLFSRDSLPYWSIFFLAFCVRAVQQVVMSANDPMYEYLLPGGDNHTYARWGQEIAQTFWLGWDRIPFFHGPLYPYVLGMLYLRFGHEMDPVAWFQRGLGSVTVVLIFHLGRRIYGKRVGWVAGVSAAFCPIFLLYEGEVLADALVLFLHMLTVITLYRAGRLGGLRRWGVGGLCIGLSSLGRPNALLLLPAAALWSVLVDRSPSWKRMLPAAVLTAATLLTISPATFLNYFVGGRFALVTHTGPFNAYIGNAPDATGVFWSPPSMQEIRKAEGREDIDIDWGAHLRRAVWADPTLLPRKFAMKLRMFWESGELPHNINYYLKRQYSPLLYLPFRWAYLAPLGLIGIVLAFWQHPPRHGSDGTVLLTGYLFVYMVSLVLIFVLCRLRMPALGILMVFAGYALSAGMQWFLDFVQHGRRQALAKVFALAACWALIGGALITRDDTLLMRWNDYFNLGGAYESKGDHAQALKYYEKAADRAPDIPVLQTIRDDMRRRVHPTPPETP